jgi:hypothetical protein
VFPISPRPGTSALCFITCSEETTNVLRDLRRTLELEPRHFGAMLHFVEILARDSAADDVRFALRTARSIHPHLSIPDSAA